MTQNEIKTSSLVVGILQNNVQQQTESLVQQTSQKVGINATVQLFETQEKAFMALLEGKITVFARFLNHLPTSLPTGAVIAALSERQKPSVCWVSQNTEADKKEAKIWAHTAINCAQMQYLQPNCVVEKTDGSVAESLAALRSNRIGGIVLNGSDIDLSSLETEAVQHFNVREFVPQAGQGVLAFVAAEEDLPTRRLLKNVHTPSVSAVTNIERTLQKQFKDNDLCAYCERDTMGNYHLWAAAIVDNELRKTRVSQSTSFGMAEKAVEQLLSA